MFAAALVALVCGVLLVPNAVDAARLPVTAAGAVSGSRTNTGTDSNHDDFRKVLQRRRALLATVSPVYPQTRVVGDGAPGDEFGSSVAMSGMAAAQLTA